MKKVTLVIVLLMVICLTGCADVRYKRIFDKSGSIIDEVIISLDKSQIDASDAETIYQEVKADYITYAQAVSLWIKDNFAGMYIEDESVEAYIRQGITTGVIEKKVTADSYEFGFVTEFKTIEHFVYFYGLHLDEEANVVERLGLNKFDGVKAFDFEDYGPFVREHLLNEYTKDESPLFTTGYIWTSDNVYENFKLVERSSGLTYLEYYCNRVNELTGSEYSTDDIIDNVNITQVFETNDGRIFGNSDKVYSDPELRGYTIYEWNINEDTARTIEVQRNLPVTYVWIILAILLTFGLIIILFVIYWKKKRILGGENEQK